MGMGFVSPKTWRRWKETCLVGGCDPDQRRELHSVIVFNLRQALHRCNAGLPDYSNDELASLFDEIVTLGLVDTGTCAKDGIFALFEHIIDEQEWAKRITGYVEPMARRSKSVAALIARREGRTGPIRTDVTVDTIEGSRDDEDDVASRIFVSPTVLPDALAAAHDLHEVALKLRGGFFAGLDRVQRAAVWSIANNRSVDDPEAHKLAGKGKDALWKSRKELPMRLRLQLSRVIPCKSPELIDALALEITRCMWPLANKWAETGKFVE